MYVPCTLVPTTSNFTLSLSLKLSRSTAFAHRSESLSNTPIRALVVAGRQTRTFNPFSNPASSCNGRVRSLSLFFLPYLFTAVGFRHLSHLLSLPERLR